MFKIYAEINGKFEVVGGAMTWEHVEIVRKYWPESIVIREDF